MDSKKTLHIICLLFLFLFIIIPSLHAAPQWYRNLRITITPQMPASYQGTDAEFQANPTYIQGERANFKVLFTRELRWRWLRLRLPVYIPPECIRATFPNLDSDVTLDHLFWGYYSYTSPVLTEAGNNNHTLGIVAYYIWRFSVFGRTYRIPIQIGIAEKSISVATRSVDIEITLPIEGAVVNTNPLHVEGTVDNDVASVTVNGVSAVVSENQFNTDVNLVEGLNLITAVAVNEFGNTDSDIINVILDTVPPQNPSVNIAGGEYTNTRDIDLTFSAVDAVEMKIGEDLGFANVDWEGYIANKIFTLSSGDGSKTVYVKYRDIAQNETAPVSDTITVDTTIPQLQINLPNNGFFTNSLQVDVSGAFVEANLDNIKVNDITAVIDGNSFSVEWIQLDNEGENIIRAEIVDLAQNSNIYEITVTRDTIPPQIFSISIVEADPVSNPVIHILLDVLGADQMMVSEDINFNGVSWEDYAPEREFTLSAEPGIKNIFFKFKDMAGNETGVISRSITLVGPESQGPVRVIGRQLFVNDESYIIKGVTYQPTPIGVSPGNPYLVYTTQNCDRDLSLLWDMGCNTIRTYSIVNQTLLDKAQEYGIKVAAGFWVDYSLNLSNPAVRNQLITSFGDYINEFKDHPALLIWVIGNEQNNQNGNNPDWYSLANEMAGAARSIEGEGYHPVAITNGELGNIGAPNMLADDDSLNNIDIWGVNVYIGYSFTDYFSQYAGLSNKPLWISECGVDAYDNVHNVESQKRQAAWNTHNWEEISESDICIGVTFMSYSDEWWKAGSAYVHNNGGFSTNNMPHPDNQPDRFLNEEWWGIVAVSDNGVNPDIVTPRLAYFSLKKRWAGQADLIILQDNLPGGTFSNNGTCYYNYDDVGQFHSITYDVNNIGSYSGYYASLNGFDSRPYNSVSLSVRGQNGGEQFKLGLRDQNGNEAKINVSEYLPQGVTTLWQIVTIPLTSFGSNVDIGRLDNISITFEYAIASGSGTINIDNIGFGGDLPPLIQSSLGLSPWTHQVGDSVVSYELDPDGIVISYTVSGGTYCRLGMGLNRIDVSPYRNLSFSVRGDQNGENFHVYLEDFWNNRAYAEVNDLTTDWQTVSLPLDTFVLQGVDITNLLNLEIVFEWEDRSGTVYLDDVQFSNP